MPRRKLLIYNFDDDDDDNDDEEEEDYEQQQQQKQQQDSDSDSNSSLEEDELFRKSQYYGSDSSMNYNHQQNGIQNRHRSNQEDSSSSSTSSTSSYFQNNPYSQRPAPPPPQLPLSKRQRNQWTILFGMIPLAMLFYVWDVTNEQHALVQNPNEVIYKRKNMTIEDTFANLAPLKANTPTLPLVDRGNVPTTVEVTNRGIWIQVESWHTDISSWQVSLFEVLLMAQTLDATLVSPGLIMTKTTNQPQLVSCDKLVPGTDAPPPGLFDSYNLTILQKFHPKIATCAQYQSIMNQLTVPKRFPICLQPVDDCHFDSLQGPETSPSVYGKKTSENLDHGVVWSRQHPDEMILLKLHEVWEGALQHLRIPSPDYATQTDRIIDPKKYQTRSKLQAKYLKKILFV